MKAIWEKVKSSIRQQIPLHSYKMWIDPIRFKNFSTNCMELATPNFFSKNRILNQYAPMIESEMVKILDRPCKFKIIVSNEGASPKSSKAQTEDHMEEKVNYQKTLSNIDIYPDRGRFLRKEFTFDQFVVGENSNFAYSAALSLASLKNTMQPSLFLSSKTGMGKSHLSQSIGNKILSENPSTRLYYITAEDYTNEMVRSFQNNSINQFKKKYSDSCDVLLIEDMHYISGKARTQVELAFSLDKLIESGKKIIFSSSCLPSDIPKLNDKLKSRLTGGIISCIEPPGFKTRVKILKKKIAGMGYDFPGDVIEYLASELQENIRQLKGGMFGVAAKSSLLGIPIDIKLAESVVSNIVTAKKAITIDSIKNLVCKEFSIKKEDIVSSSRKQIFVRPRQIAMYLMRRYTDAPLQVIGKFFNRYHATTIHSIKLVERGISKKGAIKKQVDFLCHKIDSGKF